ncbi:MAG: peptidase M11, partial [Acidobacteria bacterium]
MPALPPAAANHPKPLAMGAAIAALAAIILLAPGAGFSLAQDAPAAGLPPQASARADAQFEGELEVLYEEHEDGARLLHYLHVGNGRRLRLQFEGLAPDLETGSRVRARGRLQNEALTVSSNRGVEALAIASPNTFGSQRVIVILVNFQDNPSTPYSAASAYTTTFQAASNFYAENSYGQTSLSGDVFGWYTIPMSSTTCDTNQIAALADQAAVALGGANLSAYTRKIYGFPKIAACNWWGLGSVGGNPSRAWINGSYATQ